MVAIFHLSDLHIVKNSQWDDMKKALLKEIANLAPDDEKLLIVTGDFHNYWESDYDKAGAFLKDLIGAMQLKPDEDVFVVPGNHDVGSKEAIKQVFRSQKGWKTKTSADSKWEEWQNNQKDIVDALKNRKISDETTYANRAKRRLDAYTPYCAFVRLLGVYPDNAGLLPASVHVRTWKGRLNFLHLNTTLVADDSGMKNNQQLDYITAKSDSTWDDINTDLPTLALGHNSFFDLLKPQRDELKNVFSDRRVCAYLCGDTHKQEKLTSPKLRIDLNPGRGTTKGVIPNVVGIKCAADPNDDYSEFGFYLHEWDQVQETVLFKAYKWHRKASPPFEVSFTNDDKYYMPRPRFAAVPDKKGSLLSIKHPDSVNFTLAYVFKAVVCQDIVAAWDDATNQFLVGGLEDASPKLILRYLGLSAEVFDRVATDIGTDIQDFVLSNHWNEASIFNNLLAHHSQILSSVWNTIKSNISKNIQDSLAASSYFVDKKSFPKAVNDLYGYRGVSEQPQGNRWNNIVEQICPCVRDVLENSSVGADFFSHCNTKINTEQVIDGVTALVLASLFYCQTNAEDENTAWLKVRYGIKLQQLIHEKFDIIPSGDEGTATQSSVALVLRAIFKALPLDWPEDKKHNEAEKILVGTYVFQYRDDNSPQPSPNKTL